jgi:hypothetical protein
MTDIRGISPREIETDNTGKIVGAVVIALAIGATGAYTYEIGLRQSPPMKIATTTGFLSPALPRVAPAAAPAAASSVVLQPAPIAASPADVPTKTERHAVVTRLSRLARTPSLRPKPLQSLAARSPTPVPELASPLDNTKSPPMTTPSLDAPVQNAPQPATPVEPVSPVPEQ